MNFSVPVEVSPGQVQDIVHYTAGAKDFPAIFFYLLIAIVMHQIIQEYLLDRVNRKLHLSKIKHAKFNDFLKNEFIQTIKFVLEINYNDSQFRI